MAFPTQSNVREAYDSVVTTIRTLKPSVAQERAKIANSAVSASLIINLMGYLNDTIVRLDSAVASVDAAALAQYAKDQQGDQQLNIVTEYQTTKAAVATARDWTLSALISLDTPQGRPDLFLWKDVYYVDYRQFSTQATAGLLPLLDAITASIA